MSRQDKMLGANRLRMEDISFESDTHNIFDPFFSSESEVGSESSGSDGDDSYESQDESDEYGDEYGSMGSSNQYDERGQHYTSSSQNSMGDEILDDSNLGDNSSLIMQSQH